MDPAALPPIDPAAIPGLKAMAAIDDGEFDDFGRRKRKAEGKSEGGDNAAAAGKTKAERAVRLLASLVDEQDRWQERYLPTSTCSKADHAHSQAPSYYAA